MSNGCCHLKMRECASEQPLNHVMAREGDLPTLLASAAATDEEPETTQLMPNNAVVLIAEIPASGDRWKQANFDLDNYRNFFGAREDVADRLVIFRHVNADGTMAEYERNRPPVTVKSRNFRFELAAASGIPYPDERTSHWGLCSHGGADVFLPAAFAG